MGMNDHDSGTLVRRAAQPIKLSMEERIDYEFFDAFEDFPCYDCVGDDQFEESASDYSLSLPDPVADVASLEITSSTSSLRLRSISRRISGEEFGDSNFPDSSSLYSSVTQVLDSKARRHKLLRELKENEKNLDKSKPTDTASDLEYSVDIVGEKDEVSTLTMKSDDRFGDSVDSVEEPRVSSSSSLLVFFAGLVIKAIPFQINLLIKFFTFPFWALYCFFVFVVDPIGALRRGRECVTGKLMNLWNYIWGIVGRGMSEWLQKQKSIWKLLLRFLWGLLWSIYVGLALFSLLMLSVALSGLLVRNVVEQPVEIEEKLNFDYTKNSPVALVRIWSCPAVGCGVNCKENVNVLKIKRSRLIPVNHKLQVIISLTMPESEYNRNLGIFQVRVDFLSANGETFASSSHPCMLKFKSEPTRLLSTFLKIVPQVAGYMSDSQTMNLKMRGYTEGDVPTTCLKVILEQRAEYKPGVGIPEIYGASLVLESELPLLKRIVWMWKKTIFVWSCIMLFVMELLFTLVCCGTLIVPRPRGGSTGNGNVQSSLEQQGS